MVGAMKEKTYTYNRMEVADAAGVTVDVVRMEEKKGTFGTASGLCAWVVAKMLTREILKENGISVAGNESVELGGGMTFIPMEEHEFGA